MRVFDKEIPKPPDFTNADVDGWGSPVGRGMVPNETEVQLAGGCQQAPAVTAAQFEVGSGLTKGGGCEPHQTMAHQDPKARQRRVVRGGRGARLL